MARGPRSQAPLCSDPSPWKPGEDPATEAGAPFLGKLNSTAKTSSSLMQSVIY